MEEVFNEVEVTMETSEWKTNISTWNEALKISRLLRLQSILFQGHLDLFISRGLEESFKIIFVYN